MMFYGTAAVAIVSIFLLIIVCCLWRRKAKRVKKLQQQHKPSSLYANNGIIGFPSPLQLDTFLLTSESPYDTPEPVETVPEDSYVTVVDKNELESPYTTVRGIGTANSIADSESRDDIPMPSPAYTNASVFQIEPYQELNQANRNYQEDPYTSLINRKQNEDSEKENADILDNELACESKEMSV